jgi:hypothetical protein
MLGSFRGLGLGFFFEDQECGLRKWLQRLVLAICDRDLEKILLSAHSADTSFLDCAVL